MTGDDPNFSLPIPIGNTCGGSIAPFGTTVVYGTLQPSIPISGRISRISDDDIERIARRVAEIIGEDFADEDPTAEHTPNRIAIEAKLDDQIAISRAAYSCDPPCLYLTGAEYDLWRALAPTSDSSHRGVLVTLLEESR